MTGVAILRELGWPEEVIAAVHGHGVQYISYRTTPMARCLFAVDELSGFVIACALVRPDKSLQALTVTAVRKKWKDKAFARGVSRADIELGASELGVGLDDHIAFVIDALKPIAQDIGLASGQPAA